MMSKRERFFAKNRKRLSKLVTELIHKPNYFFAGVIALLLIPLYAHLYFTLDVYFDNPNGDIVTNGNEKTMGPVVVLPETGTDDTEGLRIFVTSEVYSGDFEKEVIDRNLSYTNMTHAADSLCRLHADYAGLGGDWKAWVGYPENGVAFLGSYFDLNLNLVLVSDGQSARLIDALDTNEFGDKITSDYEVWTGVSADFEVSDQNCQGWSSQDALSSTGSVLFTTQRWAQHRENVTCSEQHRIYCLEVK